MDTDLKNKLKDDLRKTGFYSELIARKILESILCGSDETVLWALDPAGVYFDKDQNKTREIDIVAYAETFMEHRIGVVANGVYNFVENISGQKYPDRSIYNMAINEEYRNKPDEE